MSTGARSASLDWFGLFLRLDGRIGRRAFWLGFVATLACIAIAELMTRVLGLGLVVMLALIYPLIAVLVKRLHDRGRSGWWAVLLAAPLGASALAAVVARILGLGQAGIERTATLGIWIGVGVIAAVAIVELGLRRGHPGYSEHGPPPLA